MAKDYDIAVLLDFYGELLTEKRRDFTNLYYNDDLSLSEIAENEGLSRQGVRDTIKKAEEQLRELEASLHMAERFRMLSLHADKILSRCEELLHADAPQVRQAAHDIQKIALELKELG